MTILAIINNYVTAIYIVQWYRAGVIVISEACSVLLLCAYTSLNLVSGLLLPSLYLHFFIQRIFSLLVIIDYNNNYVTGSGKIQHFANSIKAEIFSIFSIYMYNVYVTSLLCMSIYDFTISAFVRQPSIFLHRFQLHAGTYISFCGKGV